MKSRKPAARQKPSTRAEQLAEAIFLVAVADHYMVGVRVAFSDEELDQAEALLITEENETDADAHSDLAATLSLALEIVKTLRDERRGVHGTTVLSTQMH